MKMEIPSSSRRWVENTKKFTEIVEEEVNTTAQSISVKYYRFLKRGTPVDRGGDDPGEMKRGWQHQVKRLGKHGRVAELKNDVKYLPYVEYGHRIIVHDKTVGFVKGRFFVKRARLRTTKTELPKAYKAMERRIKRRMGFD